MLIAITGSQGSGKSTIIEALKEAGHETITRKTSRSILSDWNVTLDEVNNDNQLTTKFQDEITKRKWDDELDAISSSALVFTERTHMDLFTYALISIGKNNMYSDWLNHYYKKCVAYSKAYEHAFFLKSGCFTVETDGVRGDNSHYSHMVDMIMQDHTKRVFPNNHTIVSSCTTETRLIEILN